jgi:hypothetical protein
MEVQRDDILINECRSCIEDQLGWGSSDRWNMQEFETLSEEIREKTGIYLSVTTLKRLWGKVKYESKPTITTLNALAKFVDFESWRDFRKSRNAAGHPEKIILEEDSTEAIQDSLPSILQFKQKKLFLRAGLMSLVALIAAGSFYFFTSWKYRSVDVSPDKFFFSSKKIVSSGVPNSVVFDYDATAASVSDSIYIQQSWDSHLAKRVSPTDHRHTSIYYYPGYFDAKLVVNREVKKEHSLIITTEGWLPLAEAEPVPVYFKESDAIQNGQLSLSEAQLRSNNISMQPEIPWVDYFNVRSFDGVTSDDFIFETEVRNDYHTGSAACQLSKIMLLTEGSAIIIPLSIEGCVSDLSLFLIDHAIEGKKEDLSGFGCDLSQWAKVRCEVKSGKASFFVNDQLAYQTAINGGASKITGIVYRFQGTGSVNSVKLCKSDGTLVYEDNFNEVAGN